jgi:predicted MFS family arabinose efflux permease
VTERESLVSVQLWLAFAVMLFVAGVGNTFPVLFPPLFREFGGSRPATALSLTRFRVGGAVLGPLAGSLVDRTAHSYLAIYLVAVALLLTALAALTIFIRTAPTAP